jgi:hypothetical protein
MARGGATGQGSATTCRIFLAVDYDAAITFEGDTEPVRKSLSNVVLGVFEVRRTVPSGDFEFQLSSNSTVRPIAQVIVSGESGMNPQTITFTETRIQVVTTGGGATITKTETKIKTETVIVTERVPPITTTVTVGQTVTVTTIRYITTNVFYRSSGLFITKPFDSFIFVRGSS